MATPHRVGWPFGLEASAKGLETRSGAVRLAAFYPLTFQSMFLRGTSRAVDSVVRGPWQGFVTKSYTPFA